MSTSRISSLIQKSVAVASLESESPEDLIETATGNTADNLDVVLATQADPTKPAVVSIEDAELSGDLAEAEAALDGGNDAVAQLDSAQGTLQRSADLAESTLDDGGMTPPTAAAVAIAVDGVRERLGIDEDPVPATESFGGSTTRYNATVAALESIGDMARRVGNAIAEAVRRVREFLRNLFDKIAEFLFSLERRANGLEKRMKAAQNNGHRVQKNEFSIQDLYKRINLNGSVDTKNIDKLPELVSAAYKFDQAGLDVLKQDYEFLKKLVTSAPAQGSTDMLRGQISVDAQAIPTGIFKKDGAGWATDKLPGNVTFKIVRTEGSTKSYDSSNSMKENAANAWDKLKARFSNTFRVIREDEEHKGDREHGQTGTEVFALSFAEIASIVKVAKDVAKAKKDAAVMKEAKELNFKNVTMHSELKGEDAAAARSCMTKFAQRIGTANQASAKVIAYAARVASAYITYGFRSLDAVEKKS